MNVRTIDTANSQIALENLMSKTDSVLGDESLYQEEHAQSELFEHAGDMVEPGVESSHGFEGALDDFDRGLNAPTDGEDLYGHAEQPHAGTSDGAVEPDNLSDGGDFVEVNAEDAAKINADQEAGSSGPEVSLADSLEGLMDIDEEPTSPEESFQPDFLSPEAFARSGRPLSDLQASLRPDPQEPYDELYGPTTQEQQKAAARAPGAPGLAAGLSMLTGALLGGLGRTIAAGGNAATSMIHSYRFNSAQTEFNTAFSNFAGLTKDLQQTGLSVLEGLEDQEQRAQVMAQFLDVEENRDKINAVMDSINEMEMKAKRLAKVGITAGHDDQDVYRLTGEKISRFLKDNEKFLKAVEQDGQSLADRLNDSVVGILQMLKTAMDRLAQFFFPGQQEQTPAPASGPRLG